MSTPAQSDSTVRAGVVFARFIAGGDPGDLRTAAQLVLRLPEETPGRAALAAGLVTAAVRLAPRFSHLLLDRLTDLLHIAATDEPVGKQWASTRAAARVMAALYDTTARRVTPRAGLDLLTLIETDEGADDLITGMIGMARQAVERMSALQAGDFAPREGAAALRQMRDRYGGNPALDAWIDAVEGLDAWTTGGGPDFSLETVKERFTAFMGLVPPDSAIYQHLSHSVLADEEHYDTDEPWVPSGDPVLDEHRTLALISTAMAELGDDDAPVPAEKIDAVIRRIRPLLAGMANNHALRPNVLQGLGLALHRRYKVLRDPTDLAEMAEVFATVRELNPSPTSASPDLTEAMQSFASYEFGDRDTARRQMIESLQRIAWSVLLQADPVSATRAARRAASRAMDAAVRCLHDDAVTDAVAALDAGRGLVLLAATELRQVANRLDELGRSDLADAWRAATGEDATKRVALELRKEVIVALHAADPAGPVDPPSMSEIQTSLSTLDADALVYLVPGSANRQGVAVVVTATGGPSWTSLPALDYVSGGDLDRYLRAISVRGAADDCRTDPPPGGGRDLDADPEGAFSGSLDRLCEWSWRAAVGPVLDLVTRSTPATSRRVRRLVMIPMGDLARVPWHAARRPDAGAYAIQECAVSYEVAARSLCESARRSAVPVSSLGFVLGDPDTTDPSTGRAAARALPAARAEAFAVREAFYRAATYAGRRPDGTTGAGGTGSRDTLRSWLTSPQMSTGAMLHLACHGLTRSAAEHDSSCLILAGGERLPAEELLALVSRRRKPIGLVVLAACRSGVSTRGYDEVYSLGTAFVAAGVRTALSSQWSVPDDSTSLLMFMFHHYLRAEGCRPWDALRRAQLWMLDPDREAPDTMPGQLRMRLDAGTDPADPVGWAAFIHMGQ